MSWDAAAADDVRLDPSPRETARFGHEVARLTVGHGWAGTMDRNRLGERLRGLLQSTRARTVILRYPSHAAFVMQELGDHGREVFPASSLLYWEHTGPAPTMPDAVQMLEPDEISPHAMAEVREVIADSFEGYVNHYAANPLIATEAVAEGYLEWAQSTVSTRGNRVFLVHDGGRCIGVATVECPSGCAHWEIQLAGIHSRHQRRGHYAHLVNGVLAAAHAAGVGRVVISTQAHNTNVQRAWARLGFLPFSSIDTVHLIAGAPPA